MVTHLWVTCSELFEAGQKIFIKSLMIEYFSRKKIENIPKECKKLLDTVVATPVWTKHSLCSKFLLRWSDRPLK